MRKCARRKRSAQRFKKKLFQPFSKLKVPESCYTKTIVKCKLGVCRKAVIEYLLFSCQDKLSWPGRDILPSTYSQVP